MHDFTSGNVVMNWQWYHLPAIVSNRNNIQQYTNNDVPIVKEHDSVIA